MSQGVDIRSFTFKRAT